MWPLQQKPFTIVELVDPAERLKSQILMKQNKKYFSECYCQSIWHRLNNHLMQELEKATNLSRNHFYHFHHYAIIL